MATFWERAAHSVYRMFSLYFDLCNFSYFLLWFWGRDFGSGCICSCSLLIIYFLPFRIIIYSGKSSEHLCVRVNSVLTRVHREVIVQQLDEFQIVIEGTFAKPRI